MTPKRQQEFVNFMLDEEALKFGSFTLKSGRVSPFFMNMGVFNNGYQLRELAEYYAEAIYERYGANVDVVFGPAYKGIPLAAAVACAYYELYAIEISYCANRKEAKDHGETGILLGAELKEGMKVVIVEDVTTSGKSMEETVPILQQFGVEILGLVVSLDRHEIGKSGEGTALEEISRTYGFPTNAIVSMPEVIEYLKGEGLLSEELLARIEAYYAQYGPKTKEG